MSTTVHVNSLRWFAEQDGGAEFVRSHGDHLDDDAIARAQALAYPDAIQVVTILRESGVGAECWFTLSAPDTAQGSWTPAPTPRRSAGSRFRSAATASTYPHTSPSPV